MAVGGEGGVQIGGKESFSKDEMSFQDWYTLGVIFPIDDECQNNLEGAMKMKDKI